MDDIFFPTQYKKSLLSGRKDTTVRIGNELGKYRVGNVYRVKSYAGRAWNVKIKIQRVFRTTFDRLAEFGIPKRSIEFTKKKERISARTRLDLIKFKVL